MRRPQDRQVTMDVDRNSEQWHLSSVHASWQTWFMPFQEYNGWFASPSLAFCAPTDDDPIWSQFRARQEARLRLRLFTLQAIFANIIQIDSENPKMWLAKFSQLNWVTLWSTPQWYSQRTSDAAFKDYVNNFWGTGVIPISICFFRESSS